MRIGVVLADFTAVQKGQERPFDKRPWVPPRQRLKTVWEPQRPVFDKPPPPCGDQLGRVQFHPMWVWTISWIDHVPSPNRTPYSSRALARSLGRPMSVQYSWIGNARTVLPMPMAFRIRSGMSMTAPGASHCVTTAGLTT